MGALIVAPLILVWSTNPLRSLDRRRLLEGGLLLVALVGLSVFVFLAGYWRYPHLIFPVLVWTTLRFRQPGAVTGSFIVTAIAIAGAVDGSIPLADRSDTEIVEILEGLLAGLAVSLLILGAVLEERGRRKPPSTKLSTSRTSAAGTGTSARTASAGRTSFFRIYGLEPQSQEVTFDVYLERVHPDDREFARETVERAREEAQPFLFDHRIVLPDGGVRWTQSRGRVVTDHEGRPLRMVGTAQDVTERKQLDSLRDTILATVSHELRTPLTAILGFAITLRERGAEIEHGQYRGSSAATCRTGRETRPPPDGSPGSRPTPSRLPDPGVRGDRRLRARRADHEHARSRGAVESPWSPRSTRRRSSESSTTCSRMPAGTRRGNGRQRPRGGPRRRRADRRRRPWPGRRRG